MLPPNRRLFIEPGIALSLEGETRRIYPDIVVCNSKSIIGVIEIKYLPRGKARYEKDLKSLSSLARFGGEVSISNERFRGREEDSKEYQLARNPVFVWGSIHKQGSAVEFDETICNDSALNRRFLKLFAETVADESPVVTCTNL